MSEPTLVAPSSVWGRMRVWCQGVPIGDYGNKHCGLFVAYRLFKQLLADLPTLWDPAFDQLSDVELYNHLDGKLYGYHGKVEIQDDRSLEEMQTENAPLWRFNFLTNVGEQFDSYGKTFIFSTPAQVVRVLYYSLDEDRPVRLDAPLFQALRAIREFVAWFENESLRLGVSFEH